MSKGVALMVGALMLITMLVMGFWPELDIKIAHLFYDATSKSWLADGSAFAVILRWLAIILTVGLGLFAFGRILWICLYERHSSRSVVAPMLFLLMTVLAAPVALVNGVLKDHWHRPRPVQISEFGGPHAFKPWWSRSGGCNHNCSFVSGEASSAAWLVASAALAPLTWRGAAYGGALAVTIIASALRMMHGKHFFSDVILAICFTYFIVFAFYWFFRRKGWLQP